MSSLKDVATLAGVSIATASKVLNTGKELDRISEDCADRVRRAARELAYTPNYHAQSLMTRKAYNLGFSLDVAPGQNAIGGYYTGSLIGGAECKAREEGYLLTLTGPSKTETGVQRALGELRKKRFDGLLVPGLIGQELNRSFLTESELPVILLEYDDTTLIPVIDVDAAAGIIQAVEHLIKLGHRDILWLGFDQPSRFYTQRR